VIWTPFLVIVALVGVREHFRNHLFLPVQVSSEFTDIVILIVEVIMAIGAVANQMNATFVSTRGHEV
jgi:hypothetical protein